MGKLTATRRDYALVATSGLLVVGTVCFAFGLSSWLFSVDMNLAWIFWMFGFGLWALAGGVFFAFMMDPYPKHRRYR